MINQQNGCLGRKRSEYLERTFQIGLLCGRPSVHQHILVCTLHQCQGSLENKPRPRHLRIFARLEDRDLWLEGCTAGPFARLLLELLVIAALLLRRTLVVEVTRCAEESEVALSFCGTTALVPLGTTWGAGVAGLDAEGDGAVDAVVARRTGPFYAAFLHAARVCRQEQIGGDSQRRRQDED